MKKESKIVTSSLSVKYCEEFVRLDSCGAIVVFRGTVRNHSRNKTVRKLEFDTYKSMAEKELQNIISLASEKWNLKAAIIHHRTGIVEIGEDAVVIAVSSYHRDTAFAANHFLIDSLKKSVPIWKKEIYSDGHKWISAHP